MTDVVQNPAHHPRAQPHRAVRRCVATGHLNVLHIIRQYHRLKQNPGLEIPPPRTFIFGGKAAPGYYMAKLIIQLINAVAEVVNNDLAVRGRLKVVFYPDFNVTDAQPVLPAGDLSEQISTAGEEASKAPAI